MARGSYMQFDETTSDLSDNAFRVLCYLRHHVVKSNEVYPSIESMSEDLRRSVRTCKYAIAELKSAGLVEVERNARGQWFYRVHCAKSCTPKVQKSAPSSATDSATHSATHSAKFCTPLNNPHIGKATEATEATESSSSGGSSQKSKPAEITTTTTEDFEPFESGNPAPLPTVRRAEPFRARTVELRPTEFRPETRDRILSVLGTEGDHFARKVTQEQADAGFVDWILDEAGKNKTPGRLAWHLLKTAWSPGWINPKAAKEAKRAALRKRLEALR